MAYRRWTYILIISLLILHLFFLFNSLKSLLGPLRPLTKQSIKLEELRRKLLEL